MLVLAESCDKFYTYKFILHNESGYPISIFLKIDNKHISDTLIHGEQMTIFDDFASKPDLFCEMPSSKIEFIDSLKIQRIDTLKFLIKDISSCTNWKKEKYSKNKDSFIDFIFTFTPKDF